MTDILTWVKAHWLVVLFCVIIVGVTPAGVYLGNGRDTAVREPLDSRVRSMQQSIKKVEGTMVEITPLQPGVAKFDEKMVITEAVLDDYRQQREAIKEQADEILGQAQEINRAGHYQELIPGLLPAPQAASAQSLPYLINPAYLDAHENLLVQLNAGEPISDEVLGSTLDDFQGTFTRTQLNQEVGEGLDDEQEELLLAAMTTRRMLEYRQHAEGISVYADLSIFELQSWDDGRGQPAPSMWFDWQHAYWVNQDIVQAIVNANSSTSGGNAGLDSISGEPGSTVKRIIEVRLFPMFDVRAKKKTNEFGGAEFDEESFGMMEGGFGMMEGEGGGGPPRMNKGGKGGSYEQSEHGDSSFSDAESVVDNNDATVAFQDDFANSLSGRSSNPLYDVRRVALTAIVDSNRLPLLINSIQQTNFMTVTGCQMRKVNMLSELGAGFYYGNEAVVEVTLDIETLWLRDWTTQLMPDDVKEVLGIDLESDEATAEEDQ